MVLVASLVALLPQAVQYAIMSLEYAQHAHLPMLSTQLLRLVRVRPANPIMVLLVSH